MNIDHKYIKEYNNILNKKILPLNNISTDFSKVRKILNNNDIKQKKTQLNTKFHNDKKLFKNAKLYNLMKPTKNIKKRNFSNTLIHNNLITSSLTEGNLNNNSKKFTKIFHSSTLKANNINIKFQENHPIKNIKNKIDNNELLFHNTNPQKSFKKSKSNAGLIKQSQKKHIFINIRDRNSTNNNDKIFTTIGQRNNLNIKNNSGFNKNSNLIINTNINNISNNRLCDSIPKKNEDTRDIRDIKEIKQLKKEIENYKKRLNQKDDIIKNQIHKINVLNNNYENSQNILVNKRKEFEELKQEYNLMKNNYFLLKEKLNEYETKINSMKKKEIKLMQALYLIKEKGIDINSILNELNQVTFHESNTLSSSKVKKNNEEEKYNNNIDENNLLVKNNNNLIINNIRENSNDSGMSGLTVYFPDKIKMNNIIETKWGKNIPKLNFGFVPEYNSDSDSQNNTFIEEDNLFFHKFNKFQNSA